MRMGSLGGRGLRSSSANSGRQIGCAGMPTISIPGAEARVMASVSEA